MVHGADVHVFGCNIQGNDKEINNLTTTFFSTCSVKIHEYDSDVMLSISPIMIYTFFKKKKNYLSLKRLVTFVNVIKRLIRKFNGCLQIAMLRNRWLSAL